MNLNLIRRRIETEYLLLSITENYETLIQRSHKKAELLEFKMVEPRETFHFNPPISIEGS